MNGRRRSRRRPVIRPSRSRHKRRRASRTSGRRLGIASNGSPGAHGHDMGDRRTTLHRRNPYVNVASTAQAALRNVVSSVLRRRKSDAEPPAAALQSRAIDALAFGAALLWANGTRWARLTSDDFGKALHGAGRTHGRMRRRDHGTADNNSGSVAGSVGHAIPTHALTTSTFRPPGPSQRR